jgi:hypothetical protein
MKKLIFPSMLVISLIAFAQFSQIENTLTENNTIALLESNLIIEGLPFRMEVVEEDLTFEFNTRDYLPIDFNPYSKINAIEFELVPEEENVSFEFESNEYLPIGFDAYSGTKLSGFFKMEVEEKDAVFDFDPKMYLPNNFNPYGNMSDYNGIASL